MTVGRGLAAFRIYYGLVLFANGLAKLLEFRTIEVGPYEAFLINKAEARSILAFETNERGGDGTELPLLILALVPAGRVWGLDRRLVHRGTRRLDRWPF
jgi:hypothetical protein